jgi:hypothetical protein
MNRLAEFIKIRGTAQVDLIFSEGKWYIIEINARHSMMSPASVAIEGKTVMSVYAELISGNISDPLPADQYKFVIDFKTRPLSDNEIHSLMEENPAIRSALQFELEVSTASKVEYCEFVIAADSCEGLVEEMNSLQKKTKDLISPSVMEQMDLLIKRL